MKRRKTLPNLYFSYGSNMNHEQMSRRCPTAVYVGPYFLRGWELAFGNHATIVPKAGAVVPGAMWSLAQQDLYNLDRYEGWPVYYEHRRWRQDNDYFFFYEMLKPITGSPSSYYIDGIIEGYLQCGLDPSHIMEKI